MSSSSSSSLRALAAQLRNLKHEETQLRTMRKRLRKEKSKMKGAQDDHNNKIHSRDDHDSLLAHLPTNTALEASIAVMFARGRDPRILLDITQRLLGCTVLSLAANTSRWDPLDVKPQVFAFGRNMALPIFTSIPMLRRFCWQHDFSVRGPDGAVWAQAGCPDVEALLPAAEVKTTKAEAKKNQQQGLENKTSPSSEEGGLNSKKSKKKKKLVKMVAREKRRLRQLQEVRDAALAQKALREEKQKLLAAAADVEQFEMRTVTPLHIWGQPRRCSSSYSSPPFVHFHGFYGLFTTVLENASILPGKTDVVINPATPLELALSHGLTSEHFSRNAADYLVHTAFLRVEKQVRKEFATFLSRWCPEVLCAKSVTMRRNFGADDLDEDFVRSPMDEEDDDLQAAAGLVNPVPRELLQPNAFDIVVLIDTLSFSKTASAIQGAKRSGSIVGHAALRVIPLADAPRHVADVAETFYTGERLFRRQQQQRDGRNNAKGGGEGSELMEVMGDSVIVNPHVASDSFYSNPELAYTEAHAMALKKRL